MQKNAYLLVKIGADTAEKEQRFAEILTKFRDVTRGRDAVREPNFSELPREVRSPRLPHCAVPASTPTCAQWHASTIDSDRKIHPRFCKSIYFVYSEILCGNWKHLKRNIFIENI